MAPSPEEQQRRRALAWALTLTQDTSLAPGPDEQALLERYARGELSLSELLTLAEPPVHHVLYRSQAVQPYHEPRLRALLDESRAYNQQHALTGLLCYGDGFFVQVLEGPPEAVRALYARIQRDPRHQYVRTLSEGRAPQRWFADWRLAYVQSEPLEMYWLISYLEARHHALPVPQVPITDPHLLTLLDAFRHLGR